MVYQGSNPDTSPSPNEYRMYLQDQPGDSIYCPFECDEFSFYRITGSTSQHVNHNHKILIDYIRCANLDEFWSLTQGSLYLLTHMFSEEVTTGQNLGFQMFPASPGPFPTYYYGGL